MEDEICEAKSGMSVANDLILQAQSDLEKALQKKGKYVKRDLIETATSKLKVGNERKHKFEEHLCKEEKENDSIKMKPKRSFK